MLFTFDSYKKLLDTITGAGYAIHGIEKVLEFRLDGFIPEGKFTAIRHDVDYYPKRALVLAKIEADQGIATTYYIRRKFFESDIPIITKIAELGHQIGYHYEEIDTHQKAPNNQVARDAVGFFVGSLLDLDKLGFPIKSVCAHGNPISDVDNRQVVHLLRDDNFLDQLAFTYDRDLVAEKVTNRLIGDASIDITGKDFDVYIPDTGRFNPRYNLKDHIDDCKTAGLNNLEDLSAILGTTKNHRVYMNMHPDRWSGDILTWMFDFGLDSAKNMVKRFMGTSDYKGQLVGQKSESDTNEK
ncbi:MAG: hypothetical protein KAR42_01140 [candidate division Zixibacteria bacterium]|nr:hypothetical protein [candidate division Zixibacteria bacterium]